MLIRDIGRGILRHKKKSAAVFLTVLVLSTAFMLFASSVWGLQAELKQLGNDNPVEVQISNLTGTITKGLYIKDNAITELMDSNLVEPIELSTTGLFSELQLSTGAVKLREDQGKMQGLSAVYTDMGVADIEYLEGYDGRVFSGKEPVCVMDKGFLKSKGLKLGDSYKCYLYTHVTRGYKSSSFYITEAQLKIVGSYGKGESGIPNGQQFMMPYYSFRQFALDGERGFSADSARFRLKDPNNLNALKDCLKEAGILEIQQATAAFSNYGEQAVVWDQLYVNTAEPIARNIKVMLGFYPLIALVVAITGLLVSGLTVRDRREETAIQLSLGASRARIFLSLTGEILVLALLGSIIGAVAVSLFVGSSVLDLLPQMGIMLGAYVLGSITWVWAQAAISPMVLLAQRD